MFSPLQAARGFTPNLLNFDREQRLDVSPSCSSNQTRHFRCCRCEDLLFFIEETYQPAISFRTRTRTNTNPYDTKAIAVGRSRRACGARKIKNMCGEGGAQCECRVAPVFGVCCVKPESAVWCHQLSLCGAPSRGMCEAPLMLGR